LDRLRQDAQPDRPRAAGTAHTLGHTLGGAAAAAANNKPLRHAVTFGLIWTGVLIFTLAGRQPRIAVPTAD
jgi:hypothetical protein